MRYAYDKSTTRIVSCKSNLQLAYDCRVRHEECRGLLKHVLKPYDNRSDRQFDIVEIVYDFSMTRAARATKIACDNREQKSYHVNRPLYTLSRFLPKDFFFRYDGDDVPDTMNVHGVYDTSTTMQSFYKREEYQKWLQQEAGMSGSAFGFMAGVKRAWGSSSVSGSETYMSLLSIDIDR